MPAFSWGYVAVVSLAVLSLGCRAATNSTNGATATPTAAAAPTENEDSQPKGVSIPYMPGVVIGGPSTDSG